MTSTLPRAVQALRRLTPTRVHIPHRSVLSISGSQTSQFLNGLVSSSIPVKGHSYSAFLNAQGRVLYDVFLYRAAGENAYLLEFDSRPSEAPPLYPLLKKYVLRSKVKIRDVSEEYNVWAIWGSSQESTWETQRRWSWAKSGVCEPLWNTGDNDPWPWGMNLGNLLDRRAVGMGARLLLKAGEIPSMFDGYEEAQANDYTLHRILQGVPEGSVDIPGAQAFPMDSNLDIMGALDFRKGCYIGQELTVRTYHTGVVRKRTLPILIHGANSEDISGQNFPPGLDIRAVPQEGKEITRPRGTGKLLSSMRGVGLALLRLDHIEGFRKGNLKLQLQDNDGKMHDITFWWPLWWPGSQPHLLDNN